jgi:PAS domain-containing protein
LEKTALTSEIQERHQVSEALTETEQRYELLIESVTNYAIISLDLHGISRDWNKGAERIKGYRAEELSRAPSRSGARISGYLGPTSLRRPSAAAVEHRSRRRTTFARCGDRWFESRPLQQRVRCEP